MKKFIKFFTLVPVLASAAACTETYTDEFVDLGGVYASMALPESGDGTDTKALSSDFKFSFVTGDRINVFPTDASSDEAMTYVLNPDAADAAKAEFESKSFKMSDADYTALYPSQNVTASIALSFAGQDQASDGSTAHLAAYDYSWASASISANKGNFALAHRVAWMKITIQATDAANIRTITVSADEGVANTASIDVITGVVTPSRTAGDVLTLTLGGDSGIDVAANGTLTAYLTIPVDTYTNLTLTANDAAGKTYRYVRPGEKTLSAGKYYSPTMLRTDLPEETPFTALTVFGTYSSTNTSSPVSVKLYNASADQMSYGTGSDYRTFKLANLAANSYAIFTIASSTLTVGETYTVSSDINGTKTEASCKVVKMTDDCIWLEDKTNNIGYIFAIE